MQNLGISFKKTGLFVGMISLRRTPAIARVRALVLAGAPGCGSLRRTPLRVCADLLKKNIQNLIYIFFHKIVGMFFRVPIIIT